LTFTPTISSPTSSKRRISSAIITFVPTVSVVTAIVSFPMRKRPA